MMMEGTDLEINRLEGAKSPLDLAQALVWYLVWGDPPSFQAAAVEVVLELPLDVVGQRRALRSHLLRERGIVLFDGLIEESVLRAMAFIALKASARTGFPADGSWRHSRILAWRCFASG
jgi:hypothetical protein